MQGQLGPWLDLDDLLRLALCVCCSLLLRVLSRMFRISLKKLLIVVGLAAALLALTTQIGMGTAEFEVLENGLALDNGQLVSGRLWGNFTGHDLPEPNKLPFVFEIRNINRPDIVKIQSGQKNQVRYRVKPFWLLKKQDPFQIYLTRHFGISADQIKGYVWTKLNAQVVIDGTE